MSDGTSDAAWLYPRTAVLDRLAPRERCTRVLVAPAGFGKSVVVEQLLGELRGASDPPRVVRLSLRRHDGPARLALRLASVVTSLGGDDRALGRSVDPGSTRLGRPTSRAFADALAPLGEVVLVIDTTRGPAGGPTGGHLAADLDGLVGELPPTVQVVLEQRRPWGPGDGGRDEALVVRARDLLLTAEEAGGLVAAASGRHLTDDELVDLMARTGGWPLAVRLAAAAMRGTADPTTALRSIRPGERRIAAFLQDEVVGWQPPAVRSLLLRTSVLDVLTPAACEAVTGDPEAGRFGALVEAEGIATSTDEGAGTVALHPMLRGFLRAALHEADAREAAALEARAAAWWAENGRLSEAADQLVAARAWRELLDLADRHGRTVFENGQAAELLRWLDAVPLASGEWGHEVGLRRALALTMLGETRRAEGILDELGDADHRHGGAEQLIANTIRSIWVYFDGDPATVLGRADAALAVLDRSQPDQLPDLLGITSAASLRSLLQASRGRARWYLRDVAGARVDLGALVDSGDVYPPWRVNATGTLALIEAWSGNLDRAGALVELAMREAGAHGLLQHPSTLEARAAGASVHRERGDLDAAVALLDELLVLASRQRRPATMAIVAIERGLWHLAAGRPDQGLAVLAAERRRGEAQPPKLLLHRAAAVEIRLLLAKGEVGTARRRLAAAAPDGEHLPPELGAVTVLCPLGAGEAGTARAALDRWSGAGLDLRSQLEHGLLTACVELAEGQRSKAVEHTLDLLDLAAPEGHRRAFLDLGQPVDQLLRAALRARPTPDLQALVSAANVRPVGAAGLSDRELDVVRFLPTALSNAEIAAQLYISLNTLKSHLASIYRKLGASDRGEACRRAEELGLA